MLAPGVWLVLGMNSLVDREKVSARWRAFSARKDVRLLSTLIKRSLFAAVLIYLIYKLTQVGWLEVVENLPSAPLFYLLFLLRYFALPLSEIPAYELIWKRPLWRHIAAFVRKRVYNFAVMGYSGEAVFTLWARRNLELSDPIILAGVKDNNILSAFASNVATVMLILVLVVSGKLGPILEALPGAHLLFALAFGSSIALVVIVVLFGRNILHTTPSMTWRLASIHGGRILIVMVLHAMMYAAALPTGAYEAWVVFIALQLVLSRIPFLPNLDLVFLGAALTIAAITGVPEAAIAGVLVAEAGLSQLLNFSLFLATSLNSKDAKVLKGEKSPESDQVRSDI